MKPKKAIKYNKWYSFKEKIPGFIKLHREIINWEWYDDHNVSRLFLHILLTVNYKDNRYQGYDIPAGSRVSGLPKLADETGLSVRQVRTAIDKLKLTGSLTVKTTPKFSIISITNWDKYQEDDSQLDSRMTGERQADDRRATTSKEDKKERKEEENIPPLVPPKRVTSKGTKIPDDFMPNETCLNVAQEEGFDNDSLNRELANFIDYWKGNGKTKLDWQATFRNWLRNNKNYNRSNSYGKRQEPKSDVEIYAQVLREIQDEDSFHGTRDGIPRDYPF